MKVSKYVLSCITFNCECYADDNISSKLIAQECVNFYAVKKNILFVTISTLYCYFYLQYKTLYCFTAVGKNGWEHIESR
jgi:hypothetical protein